MQTDDRFHIPVGALAALVIAALACNFGGAAPPTAPAASATAERPTGEPNNGPSMVEQKYVELGGEEYFGVAMTDELDAPDGFGRYRDYDRGAIYWSPETGAFSINGMIWDKWFELGGLDFLGYPLTDELTAPDGRGHYNEFQHGYVYWTPETGAKAVYGYIYDKWRELGGEASFLGYPKTDEEDNSNGHGRHNHFEGGSIYWTSENGAFVVGGLIFEKWRDLGLEGSWLGLPISDEEPSTDPAYQRQSRFEHGVIRWHPDTGAVAIEE